MFNEINWTSSNIFKFDLKPNYRLSNNVISYLCSRLQCAIADLHLKLLHFDMTLNTTETWLFEIDVFRRYVYIISLQQYKLLTFWTIIIIVSEFHGYNNMYQNIWIFPSDFQFISIHYIYPACIIFIILPKLLKYIIYVYSILYEWIVL